MWKGQKPKVLQEAKKSFETINIPNVDYTHGGTCQCSNNVSASNITDSQKQPNPFQLFCSSKGFIVSRAWSDLLITAPQTSPSPPSSWHLLSKNTLHLRETNFKLSAPFFFPPSLAWKKFYFWRGFLWHFFYSRNYFNYTCLKQPETLCHICQSGLKHLKQLSWGDYFRN